jgi:tRNA U34 5-methylaminomethyl-2-thiouridine-forming methyltransferase MnmC
VHGAITESKHVFIKNGLHFSKKHPVIVFEIGFGTGLNAFLTCLEAMKNKSPVIYYAIEKYPLETCDILLLNYAGIIASGKQDKDIFGQLHAAPWGKLITINSDFSIYKIKGDLLLYEPDFVFDLIYFDAFAPEKQPEMWTSEIFSRLFNRLNEGGILVTYCVKGDVKRTLKETGFKIEKLPGPPGKREVLRAVKSG